MVVANDVTTLVKNGTMADLLRRLGSIPPRRVLLFAAPGQATEKDVLRVHDKEGRLCELVDGVLVEKDMGFVESLLAYDLGYFLKVFLERHDLGIAVGADGMMRLASGLVRIPDISFISWDRLPGRRIPRQPIPALAPDLAVEVLSAGNTAAEMRRKLREYFAAGVQLVWYVDPRKRIIQVFTAPDEMVTLREDDTLDGGDVLPGFRLSVRKLFQRAERKKER
jgi:Uma2 family endonuclease